MERIPQKFDKEKTEEKTFAELITLVKQMGHSEPKGFEKEGIEGTSDVRFVEPLEFTCEDCRARGVAKRSKAAKSDKKWLSEGEIFTSPCTASKLIRSLS